MGVSGQVPMGMRMLVRRAVIRSGVLVQGLVSLPQRLVHVVRTNHQTVDVLAVVGLTQCSISRQRHALQPDAQGECNKRADTTGSCQTLPPRVGKKCVRVENSWHVGAGRQVGNSGYVRSRCTDAEGAR
jgi:hypothetical protein